MKGEVWTNTCNATTGRPRGTLLTWIMMFCWQKWSQIIKAPQAVLTGKGEYLHDIPPASFSPSCCNCAEFNQTKLLGRTSRKWNCAWHPQSCTTWGRSISFLTGHFSWMPYIQTLGLSCPSSPCWSPTQTAEMQRSSPKLCPNPYLNRSSWCPRGQKIGQTEGRAGASTGVLFGKAVPELGCLRATLRRATRPGGDMGRAWYLGGDIANPCVQWGWLAELQELSHLYWQEL